MRIQKVFLTLLIISMILNKSQVVAYSDSCEYCDYDGCGYSDCRRAACLMVAYAWGAAIFTGMYLIILNDGKSHSSHGH